QLVRHVWVVRWSVPAGENRSQRVLAYPAYNAVFQPAGAALFGADPRLSVRDLTGTSWAVGILFRPAAGVLLTETAPSVLLGSSEPLEHAPAGNVARAMSAEPHSASTEPHARTQLVRILRQWLLPLGRRVDERGRLINEVCRLAEEDDELLQAAELAE